MWRWLDSNNYYRYLKINSRYVTSCVYDDRQVGIRRRCPRRLVVLFRWDAYIQNVVRRRLFGSVVFCFSFDGHCWNGFVSKSRWASERIDKSRVLLGIHVYLKCALRWYTSRTDMIRRRLWVFDSFSKIQIFQNTNDDVTSVRRWFDVWARERKLISSCAEKLRKNGRHEALRISRVPRVVVFDEIYDIMWLHVW